MIPTDGIVEIAEAMRPAEVNAYLAHGYKLVSLFTIDVSREFDGVPRLAKSIRYVVGRTAEVPHMDPPERQSVHAR